MLNWEGRLIPLSWKYRIRCASLDVTSHFVPVWISANRPQVRRGTARVAFPAQCVPANPVTSTLGTAQGLGTSARDLLVKPRNRDGAFESLPAGRSHRIINARFGAR